MKLLEDLIPPVDVNGDDGLPRPSRMRHEEQVATAAVGAANAVVCIALLFVLPSNEMSPGLQRIVIGAGLVVSIACVAAARYGNRLVGSMAMLTAGFLGPGSTISPFLVIPHYGVAMWIILRQNRMVKEQTALRRKQRLEGGGKAPARSGRGGRRQAPKLPDGRPAPPPSKRYTPPRPKKRPVPVPDDKAKAKGRTADAE